MCLVLLLRSWYSQLQCCVRWQNKFVDSFPAKLLVINTDLSNRLEFHKLELLSFDASEVISYRYVTSEVVLALRTQPVDHLFTQQHVSDTISTRSSIQ